MSRPFPNLFYSAFFYGIILLFKAEIFDEIFAIVFVIIADILSVVISGVRSEDFPYLVKDGGVSVFNHFKISVRRICVSQVFQVHEQAAAYPGVLDILTVKYDWRDV